MHLPTCGLSNLPLSVPRHNLTSLLVLDLSNNDINSTIPPWLFNMSNLVYLDVSSNNLQGEIDDFSRLNSLEHLDLSEDSFISGKLSGKLGKLCNLHVLDLSFNKISGEINDFILSLAECTNCRSESMHLGYNKLGGSLPDSLGYLRSLKLLKLMGNSFSGSFPESIGNMSSLQEFILSENQMKGSIPVSLGLLSSLIVLDISDNQWEGVITEAHFSNLTGLKELTIVQEAKNITLVFNVNPNWIPPFKLIYLDLHACMIGPTFPEWLRNQNMLSYIAVWDAKISGAIPKWFWELDLFLDVLDFSHNLLTGEMPSTIRFRQQAIVFSNYNNFTGPLPVFSSNVNFGERMPLLGDLDISYNSLNGTIPFSMSNLSYLLTFVLSSNNLSGKLPEIWNGMPYICLLDVSNNSLSGSLPISFGSLSGLRFLRLSNNKFSGELPSALQNCTHIETLDLGDNGFSGKIPAWIGEKFPSVLIISFRSNLFTGEIPLNLCIGNLSGMTTVLDSSWYEGQLWLVDKNRAYFYEGTLYLVNSIDLSRNNLCGEMPNGLTNLSRLITLNLSMNHLTGIIPADIGNLQRLKLLISQVTIFLVDDKDETSTEEPLSPEENKDEEEESIEMLWFYIGIGIGIGFPVGFWVVCGTLIVKKSRRIAYFQFIDEKKDEVIVFFWVSIARLRGC
ncbi:hypothetical protein P3X46_017473 [Hevea brasiliensis]|uniref:Disease resistance R13L4/SHOC-2-like LRR domain-containing protein n=1 Tax=Hevea brasiliensis TaxID=3981 RepID=A0ABQ9LRQ1_HEVBR|nr:hypothetical protein P3X46_017473 [Hevea brasiliensis]